MGAFLGGLGQRSPSACLPESLLTGLAFHKAAVCVTPVTEAIQSVILRKSSWPGRLWLLERFRAAEQSPSKPFPGSCLAAAKVGNSNITATKPTFMHSDYTLA